MTEAELIIGCIKKDEACQRLLFEKYAGKMMSLCLRYARDADSAQDILQEGFIRVFDKIHQFKNEGSFEGWMRRVFVTVALREINNVRLRVTDIDMADTSLSVDNPTVISKLSEDEIHQLIRGLPDGFRTVFNLHIVEGYSHDEIAAILGIQPSTSRTQLMKARKVLQTLISKQYNVSV